MSRRFTQEDSYTVLNLLADGLSYRRVSAQTGWSIAQVAKCASANRDPGPALTGRQCDKLGDGVIHWDEHNTAAVVDMRERMIASGGWIRPPIDTAVLLALAEHVHAELVRQTGGAHPTMRTALYRMMGVYGAAKRLYGSLVTATTTARNSGTLGRDFWAEADPLRNSYPFWWTPAQALRGRLRPLGRPPLTLRGTGLVVGIVVEAAGQAQGLEGAIERRLGYELPVWPMGGVGSLPRIDYVARQMLSWAEQNDADEPVLLVITDFDPTGMIIAAQVQEQLPETAENVEIVRIGIDPALAAAHDAPPASTTGQKLDTTHAKSTVWRDACSEHRVTASTTFQAEALDYATWAGIVGDDVEARLAGRPEASFEQDLDFVNAVRILAALARLEDGGSSLREVAETLERDLDR
jgi:hypothetical protein